MSIVSPQYPINDNIHTSFANDLCYVKVIGYCFVFDKVLAATNFVDEYYQSQSIRIHGS